MPLYDYECQKCKCVQEKTHKMADKNTEPCKNCGAPPEELKKLLSPIAKHGSWGRWHV